MNLEGISNLYSNKKKEVKKKLIITKTQLIYTNKEMIIELISEVNE